MKIFIHIPKTGGFSVRYCDDLRAKIITNTVDKLKSYEYVQGLKTLGYPGAEHSRWKDLYPEYRESLEAFAVVRNPWARTVSRYLFAKKRNDPVDTSSFEAFVEDRHRLIEMPYSWHRPSLHWHNQFDHVSDDAGNVRCHIMKTENLEKDVYDYFGVTLKKRYNITTTYNYRDFYNKKLIQIIGDWYQKDVSFFQYRY